MFPKQNTNETENKNEMKEEKKKLIEDTQLLRGKAQNQRKEEGGDEVFQMAAKAQERGSGEMKREMKKAQGGKNKKRETEIR